MGDQPLYGSTDDGEDDSPSGLEWVRWGPQGRRSPMRHDPAAGSLPGPESAGRSAGTRRDDSGNDEVAGRRRRGRYAYVLTQPVLKSTTVHRVAAGQIVILLLGAVVLLRPTILIEIMLANFGLAVMVVAGFWLLSRLGLGSMMFSMVSRAGRSAAPRQVEAVSFRVQTEDGERSVRFVGSGESINLGDELVLYGGRRRGVLQPLIIDNLTDSTRQFRAGFFRSILVLVAVLTLVVAGLLS